RPDLALPRVRLAELFLEERRLDEAHEEYQAALGIDPESARAMLGLGLVAFTRGDIEAARKWANQSYERDPQQRTTSELLLRVFRRLGETEAATRQQELLARLPPGEIGWDDEFGRKVLLMRRDPGGLEAVALDLLAQGRHSDAIWAFEKLAAIDPETGQWPALLGRELIRHGDLRRARQILDAAIALHPESADLHFQSGVAF